jgi:hypothetical protein
MSKKEQSNSSRKGFDEVYFEIKDDFDPQKFELNRERVRWVEADNRSLKKAKIVRSKTMSIEFTSTDDG